MKGGAPVVSKSSRAATLGWDTAPAGDLEIDVDMGFVTEATEVGTFESECPCCGTVIAFRLVCSATADETEMTDERQ